jgi:hypothetical protein
MAKVKFKPKSFLGKLSIGLIILMPILFYMCSLFPNNNEFVPTGEPIPPRPIVDLLMTGGFISGSAAFFCGIIGIIRKKDYSVLVFLCTIIGLIIFLYFLQISLFPGLIDYK